MLRNRITFSSIIAFTILFANNFYLRMILQLFCEITKNHVGTKRITKVASLVRISIIKVKNVSDCILSNRI